MSSAPVFDAVHDPHDVVDGVLPADDVEGADEVVGSTDDAIRCCCCGVALELVRCSQQGPRLGAPDADELLARRQHRRRLVHLLSRREPAAVARIPSNTLTTC